MVYEIKYDPRNGGQRKIVAVKNTAPPPNPLLNDLIESLKGLTFKFEVKITDIVSANSCEQPEVESRQISVSESRKTPDVVQTVSPTAPVHSPATTEGLVRGSIKVGSIIEACCIALGACERPTAYISYDEAKLIRIAEIMRGYEGEIDALAIPTCPEVSDIVYAKSTEDDTWYRAIIESTDGHLVDVFFFDWGLREQVARERIRNLIHGELGLCKFPACALKLEFTEESRPLLSEVLKCESTFRMRVESFNQPTESYTVTVLQKVS